MGVEGGSKVTTLAEAVRRHVRPGQVIYAGGGWGLPTALLYEVVRQSWGRDPGFTLVVAGAGSVNVVPFLRGGLVRRVVSSFAGDGYPHPGPNPVIQEARARGEVEFEDWSLLTLTLRLLAGAMGLPYLPTRSLLGSDLGRDAEAAGNLKVARDPFTGETVALVRALRPDVALVHAWAADRDGNALFTTPLGGNVYGALAARTGVLLSVERVVDRDFLAAHSDLVRLPADRVLAVVEAPYGAHPGGLPAQGLRLDPPGGLPAQALRLDPPGSPLEGYAEGSLEGYAEDREFLLEARAASRTPETADAWVRRWVLDLPDHAAYLDALGPERLAALHRRLSLDAWPLDIPTEWPGGEPPDTPPTAAERLIALAARVVADEVRAGGYRTVLAGVGAAHLACWLAREELAAGGVPVELLAEVGLVGHRPVPGDPFVFSLRNVPTALMTTDILTVLGLLVPSREGGGRCLGVIGAAQVDRMGNVNSSGLPAGGLWLVGSGGANDVASGADAVVVVAAQSPTRLVPRVAYVTSPGDRVVAVVTQWGLLRRPEPGAELALAAYYEDPAEPGPEAGVRRVRERCGWDLRLLGDPYPLPPPDPTLLRRLRLFDPQGHLRT